MNKSFTHQSQKFLQKIELMNDQIVKQASEALSLYNINRVSLKNLYKSKNKESIDKSMQGTFTSFMKTVCDFAPNEKRYNSAMSMTNPMKRTNYSFSGCKTGYLGRIL